MRGPPSYWSTIHVNTRLVAVRDGVGLVQVSKKKLDVIDISTTVEADVAPRIRTGVRFWT
jgi:hypothetical protein